MGTPTGKKDNTDETNNSLGPINQMMATSQLGGRHHGDASSVVNNVVTATNTQTVAGIGVEDPFLDTSTSQAYQPVTEVSYMSDIDQHIDPFLFNSLATGADSHNLFDDTETTQFVDLLLSAIGDGTSADLTLMDASANNVNQAVVPTIDQFPDQQSTANNFVQNMVPSSPEVSVSTFKATSVSADKSNGSQLKSSPIDATHSAPAKLDRFFDIKVKIQHTPELPDFHSILVQAPNQEGKSSKKRKHSTSSISEISVLFEGSPMQNNPVDKSLASPFRYAAPLSGRGNNTAEDGLDILEWSPAEADQTQPPPKNNVSPIQASGSGPPARRNVPIPFHGRMSSSSSSPTSSTPHKALDNNKHLAATEPPPKRARTRSMYMKDALANIPVQQDGQSYSSFSSSARPPLSAHFSESGTPPDFKWLDRAITDPEPPPSLLRRQTGYDFPVPPVSGVLAIGDDAREPRPTSDDFKWYGMVGEGNCSSQVPPHHLCLAQSSVHDGSQVLGEAQPQAQARIQVQGQTQSSIQGECQTSAPKARQILSTPASQQQPSTPRCPSTRQKFSTPRLSKTGPATTPTRAPRRYTLRNQDRVTGDVVNSASTPRSVSVQAWPYHLTTTSSDPFAANQGTNVGFSLIQAAAPGTFLNVAGVEARTAEILNRVGTAAIDFDPNTPIENTNVGPLPDLFNANVLRNAALGLTNSSSSIAFGADPGMVGTMGENSDFGLSNSRQMGPFPPDSMSAAPSAGQTATSPGSGSTPIAGSVGEHGIVNAVVVTNTSNSNFDGGNDNFDMDMNNMNNVTLDMDFDWEAALDANKELDPQDWGV
ncbi:uncharacterized protein Z518_06379 [Rhinocladiella mackenziei CBS 650.93]|uniref:Uncharacterized protein n=1 Tax=Rhinocladiella mackenziei CBS 650.93 TaxID=1442369 RepID=A0A0D2FTW8_9EURO|nr:uncharacterized protein Z518_06379 [Rhinocladiella mackenziei CBS 650.93]KIX05507.1 hypothetical protein Z518_06379 [Rhinocladiella mackenziei CBS 650.93]